MGSEKELNTMYHCKTCKQTKKNENDHTLKMRCKECTRQMWLKQWKQNTRDFRAKVMEYYTRHPKHEIEINYPPGVIGYNPATQVLVYDDTY